QTVLDNAIWTSREFMYFKDFVAVPRSKTWKLLSAEKTVSGFFAIKQRLA
ncbi:hypothetical protein BaRGS_00002382, partial [Batillaria attramentaria]